MDTIDITPVGMQSPEGIARVNAAIKEQDDSILECANLLIDLYDTFRYPSPQEERDEMMAQVKVAVERRKAASEAFLKAVSGR